MQSVECPKCGKGMRRGSTFCMGCGERLPEVEAPLDVHDNEGTNEP
ncbi:MAG: zinc-ribbon domain-containing protein, partial [Promethearchaeota archaeon]